MSRGVGASNSHVPALLALWLLATGAVAILVQSGSPAFSRFFGPINAVLGTSVVVGLGLGSLSFLQRYGWFSVHRGGRGWLTTAVLLAIPFLLPVVLVDLLGGFPSDINVTAPESVLFYPAMALVAESVFHILPLTALSPALELSGRDVDRERVVRYCIVAVALIEPAFQLVWASGQSPWWANTYVALHVFAINLVGLHLFRRFGFFSAYAFRASYYVVWHIVWGYLRLELLFGG
jgi:hypothetical protein